LEDKEIDSEIKFQEFQKMAEIWVCKGWWAGGVSSSLIQVGVFNV
jgi:hypothetical protein